MEQISSIERLNEVIAESHDHAVVIFKHSTRCPISAGAYQQVSKYVADPAAHPTYLILVVEEREVSQTLANKVGVTHESPQIILLKNGMSVHDMSHRNITLNSLLALP